MLKIGCHLSISKGYYKAGLDALAIDANTFQFFTRNPRGGSAKKIDLKDIEKFTKLFNENGFAPLFAHGPYTMNLCSDKRDIRDFAKNVFKEDLERLKLLPESYYIFHPGSHVGQGVEKGIDYIVEAMNDAIKEDCETTVLLEGMSGKGTEIGGRLEELKLIIDGVKHNKKVGICIDSCHLYSAGYDVVKDLDGVIEEIDKSVGMDKLMAVHLNDSKMEFASNKDRHEVLGKGTLGKEAIINIINHPLLKDLVFNLETPNELDGYKNEIAFLKANYKE
ncbi:deoxyribonuclease IV [Alkalibacter saccharofermentans]|uniref:Probable endonuclease 4 n=1 Tax=Alkalibacter saccharofermentans DSM 14828 TaxID=1120975 RepID=A0A1M4YNH0_9FIRM|nr:deoxyribonuclease IV [Alkalibacter saccharofermentans]SHF07187.1 Endonuclease IV [Alkalibacter saccharofermentans DSM 14828]